MGRSFALVDVMETLMDIAKKGEWIVICDDNE